MSRSIPTTAGTGSEVTGKKQLIRFRNAIIAAGSQAVQLPFMPKDDPRIVTSTGALDSSFNFTVTGLSGTPMDLDRTADVWLYRPPEHKTAHRGKERAVAIRVRADRPGGRLLGYPAAAAFGAVTPFCSCSSVPVCDSNGITQQPLCAPSVSK